MFLASWLMSLLVHLFMRVLFVFALYFLLFAQFVHQVEKLTDYCAI